MLGPALAGTDTPHPHPPPPRLATSLCDLRLCIFSMRLILGSTSEDHACLMKKTSKGFTKGLAKSKCP